MRRLLLILLLCIITLSSCRTYLDIAKDSIATDYMTFKYGKNYNELYYFNNINAFADKDVFYTTHFTINLPKNIVYWTRLDNKFYYEYSSKQLIYIYSSYKNEDKISGNWELKNIDEEALLKYLEEYWKKRGYNEEQLVEAKSNRVTKLYTNGKYEVLLYNIKEQNYPLFLSSIKSFKVK